MSRLISFSLILIVSSAAALAQLPQVPLEAAAFQPPNMVLPVPYVLDSGVQTHPGGTSSLEVWSDGVVVPWSSSLVLHFSVAELGTDDDWIEVRGFEDGETQILDRARLKQWRNETARFNGGVVEVTLHLAPGSTGRVMVDVVYAVAIPTPPETACGNADDRVLSSDDRVCRLVINNSGICTGFLISNTSTICTAGHCGFGSTITSYRAEFNVPASTAGGSIVAPPVADQYPVDVDSAEFEDTGGVGSDWAVVRLHPNSTGQTAFSRQGSVFTLANSVPFGFIPWNGPTVRVTGCGGDDGTRNFVQQTDTGALDNVVLDSVFHHADTEGGNSGGPVILVSSGQVIAIHTDGGCDSNPFSSNGATSILRTGLQNAISSVTGCASLALANGTPATATCTETIFNITPDDTKWNVVGVSSTTDWDIRMDGVSSVATGDTCDFLLANGHLGALPPRSGELDRFSGSASARAHFDVADTLSVGSAFHTTWNSTAIVRIYEFNVTAAGNYDMAVFGEPSLAWRCYRPGTSSAWRSRGSSTMVASGGVGGNVSSNVNLSTGFHAIVVSRDGNAATPTPADLTISVCSATTALALALNTETTVTSACQEFSIAPSAGEWNAVAIGGGPGSTFEVALGTGQSTSSGTITNFVLSNGNQGAIAPTNGLFERVLGSGSATAVHLGASTLTVGSQFDTSLQSGEILDLFEFDVATAGSFSITITGGSGPDTLFWRLFAPQANAEWIARSDSLENGTVGGATEMEVLFAGTHALAIYRNGTGATPATQSYSVNVCQSVAAIDLATGGSAIITAVCQPFTFTPTVGRWNVIGATSLSTSNWDLAIGESESELAFGNCELLVADGNAGTVSPNSGLLVRESGSDSAVLDYDVVLALALGNPFSGSVGSNEVVEVFELTVPTADSYDVAVSGSTALKWVLFAPGANSAWQPRSGAIQSGTVPSSFSGNLNPGVYALLIFREITGNSSASYTASFALTPNPVPSLTSILPNQATSLGSGFTLAANGLNFTTQSVIRWAGNPLTTNFVSPTQLSATVSATLIAAAGTAQITVFTPTPGGGTSSSLTFTISNPLPVISSLSPSSTTSGGAAVSLTVSGSNFRSTSTVRMGTTTLSTSFVNSTQLVATVPATLIASAGVSPVTVNTPAPGGGTSSSLNFTVNNPIPVLSSISPASATAGSSGFTMTLSGSNFRSSSIARWNGTNLATTFFGLTLSASVPASLIATAGTATVTVFTPAPGGGTSSGLTFTINNPAPVLTSLSPNVATAGSPSLTINANGSGFAASTVVRVNGNPVATTFVSATQVQGTLAASLLLTPGTLAISVFSPTPGGGSSGSLNFGVLGPALLSVNPPTISVMTPASPPVLITAIGLNFTGTSVLHANGTPLVTTFVNGTTLTANLGPAILQTQRLGGIAMHVANTATAVSNGKVIKTGAFDNNGLVSRRPLNPALGQGYSGFLEDLPPNALFSLYLDGDNVAPLAPFLDPAMNNVLAVTSFAGSSMSIFLPLVESFGLFGPANPIATTPQGTFTLPGFVLPSPALGINTTLQGVYLDATAPYGIRLTWARFPDSL